MVLNKPSAEPVPSSLPFLDAPETELQMFARFQGAAIDEEKRLSVLLRHSGWRRNRRLVAEALSRTHQSFSRQQGFINCGSHAYVLRSLEDPTKYRIAGSSCHDRFCLPCANERAFGIAQNVIEQVAKNQIRFMTLTLKSDSEPLAFLLDKLYSSLSALRRRAAWQRKVTGGVAFLEIRWNEAKQRWHPHFHILCQGSYFPQGLLKKLWYNITGDSLIVDIRMVRDSAQAARYITKYASKPFNNTFLNRQERLDESILALKGRKLCLTFGSWRGVTLARHLSDEAWENIGALERFIERAAAGSAHHRAVLASITDADLSPIYARAPPLPPTGPDRSIPEDQLTFFGTWKRNGTWMNVEYIGF